MPMSNSESRKRMLEARWQETEAVEPTRYPSVNVTRAEMGLPEFDPVTKPSHYNSHPKGYECIDIIEDNPYYNLGAVMKYVWRVSWGSKGSDIQDLKKARQQLDFEIARRERQERADHV